MKPYIRSHQDDSYSLKCKLVFFSFARLYRMKLAYQDMMRILNSQISILDPADLHR